MASDSFIEIEHKFLIPADFDRDGFLRAVKNLSPTRQAKINVRDTYYVLGHDKTRVFRHRFDSEIQQLTVKSVEGDAAVRTEVNLPIDQSAGDQRATVAKFMQELGSCWSGEISKEIDVSYFADCEVVLYRASNTRDSVWCVEFEAISPAGVAEGLRTLEKYEKALGFLATQRESRSLFELLVLRQAPDNIKKMFH